ncbi:MAG TPA: SagB/ThcOx family dehydrogenase [Thermomicrobiales bacterium]|nr:SagB/ThcOx family dehydrogenase [Thermomicrobiales bacterium]
MTVNRDTSAAREFHDLTKYTLINEGQDDADILMGVPPNLEAAIWQEDWSIEPQPFKTYTTAESLELPREFAPFSLPILDAIAASGTRQSSAVPDLDRLARICLLSNGILKTGGHGTNRVIEYRAAGGTGARYHVELYLVTGDLPGLDAGVYHYDAKEHTFRVLRRGDYRARLAEATAGESSVATAPAILISTSTFWRNAWRYKARAYRHVLWDTGTTISNILAVAAASELSTKVVMGFVEDEVNGLLGIDGQHESTICLIPLGQDSQPGQATSAIEPLDLETIPISAREVEFPPLTAMNNATWLESRNEVAEWRANPLRRSLPQPTGDVIPLRPLAPEAAPGMTVDDAIRRRRSTRHYDIETPIPFDAFSTLLERSNRGAAFDGLDITAPALADPYLIVNNVEGLTPGSYAYHPQQGVLELLEAGNMRESAARLACTQQYAGDAHVNLYYMADLEPILEAYGNRGYRVAQLQAALYASRLHLGTHALRLGAVGSTSEDDLVTEFFSPHAAGKSFLFILTFGKRRPRVT